MPAAIPDDFLDLFHYIGVDKYPWGTSGEVREIFKIRPDHVVARVVVANPNDPLSH